MRSRAPLSPSSILDTDAFRAFLKDQKIKPVIPGKSNRKKRIRHDKSAYKNRNVIERCFGRLKDFRRIATRYDKLAGNFFSALCLVAVAGAAKKHSRNRSAGRHHPCDHGRVEVTLGRPQ
jgi:IS5 family transposase